MNLLTRMLCLAVRFYRWAVSPVLVALFGSTGLGCRFTPTCSAYALEALQQHGALRGVLLTGKRLLRCHPWGGCGHDPVPPHGTTECAGCGVWSESGSGASPVVTSSHKPATF